MSQKKLHALGQSDLCLCVDEQDRSKATEKVQLLCVSAGHILYEVTGIRRCLS